MLPFNKAKYLAIALGFHSKENKREYLIDLGNYVRHFHISYLTIIVGRNSV